MAEARRPRAATEEKRKRILDATEEIMLKEGYAAVSSRSVATAVGIQAPLVHYYFPTLDDLFVAVLQRRAGRNVERMAEALASPEPLRAWWELASDPRGTALFVELLAAANHRPALKAEVGGDRPRGPSHADGRARHAARRVRHRPPSVFPPPLVAAAIQGLAFSAVQDQVAGYDTARRRGDRGDGPAGRPARGPAPSALTFAASQVRTVVQSLSSGELMTTTRPVRFGFTGGASSKREKLLDSARSGRGARVLDLRARRSLRPPLRAADRRPGRRRCHHDAADHPDRARPGLPGAGGPGQGARHPRRPLRGPAAGRSRRRVAAPGVRGRQHPLRRRRRSGSRGSRRRRSS